MVVGFPVHHIIALVVAAGDDGAVPVIQGMQIAGASVRVGDAHHPGGAAVVLRPCGADVAAHADEKSLGGCLRRPLSRPALGHSPHIQPQFRVSQEHRSRFLVNFHRCPICMGGGFSQCCFLRQSSVLRVIDASGSGLVPQLQNASHGHVYRMAGQFIVLPAIQKQADDLPVHLHRADSGMVVDGFQVV